MTLLYQRNIIVEFDSGGQRFKLSPELAISFSLTKNRSKNPNEYQVTITNLSKETRKALKQANATMRLYAGYDGESVLLCQGEIIRALTTWQNSDCQTQIDFLDGITILKNGNLTLSFQRGSTVNQVLNEIRRVIRIPLRTKGLDGSEAFRSGYSYVGKASKALDEVLRRAEARWSIQNGVLVVSGPSANAGNAIYTISRNTGLIGRIAEIETTIESEKVATKKKAKRAKNDKALPGSLLNADGSPNTAAIDTLVSGSATPSAASKRATGRGKAPQPTLTRSGYQLTTLLYPQINPGDLVQLESEDATGKFVVDEITHEGGNREDTMYSRLSVYAV